jgi:menaquinone-9 beta-reductase
MASNGHGSMQADVAILGAGPAGAAAAAHLGQLGVKNVVIVDRQDFPRDKTCGSGVSPKGIEVLKQLGVWEEVERHSYPIRGIRIVTPGDRESWQSAGDTKQAQAIVCQRRILDHIVLRRAQSHGATFVPNYTASSLLTEGDRTVGFVDREGREVRARFTFVAGGTHCKLGVEQERPRHIIQAIMGWWEGVPFRPHYVEMLFDKMVSPLYGWLFPEDDRRVNIGITYEDDAMAQNARQLFQRFLDKHYGDRLKNATQIGAWKGHPIAYSYDVGRLAGPGRLVIGEAGLMTHPATAEGIYQGMRSGVLAAEAAAAVLSGRTSEADALATYERRCREAFRVSFWGGAIFRAAVKTPALDWLVRASEQPLIQSATAKLMARM